MAVTIQVTTDGISFGKEAVEKIQVEQSVYDETIGRFITRINKSNVCKYMVKFIHTLKNLPEQHMIDSVLENFTVLQQIINRDTDELLFCIGVGGKKTLKKILDQTNFFLMLLPKPPPIAFVFEAVKDGGPHHHIYQLVKNDQNNNTDMSQQSIESQTSKASQ